jgi:hypothetical protein
MIRTQVYLSSDQYNKIKTISLKQNKSQAEIIRNALDSGLSSLRSKNNAQGLLMMAKQAIKGVPKDASKNIDKYLYETNNS